MTNLYKFKNTFYIELVEVGTVQTVRDFSLTGVELEGGKLSEIFKDKGIQYKDDLTIEYKPSEYESSIICNVYVNGIIANLRDDLALVEKTDDGEYTDTETVKMIATVADRENARDLMDKGYRIISEHIDDTTGRTIFRLEKKLTKEW